MQTRDEYTAHLLDAFGLSEHPREKQERQETEAYWSNLMQRAMAEVQGGQKTQDETQEAHEWLGILSYANTDGYTDIRIRAAGWTLYVYGARLTTVVTRVNGRKAYIAEPEWQRWEYVGPDLDMPEPSNWVRWLLMDVLEERDWHTAPYLSGMSQAACGLYVFDVSKHQAHCRRCHNSLHAKIGRK